MYRLTRFEGYNFKGLIAVDITFGDSTEISGPNGAGKSSTLDGLDTTFRGMEVAPDDPIRLGTDQAFVRSHLHGDPGGGIILTRKFHFGKDGKVVSGFRITTPEGALIPRPQDHLDKIIGDHLLDPIAFINMKDEQQFKVLQSFVPDFDFTANAQLEAGDRAKRTDFGRDRDREQAAADSIHVLVEAPCERVDEDALTRELQQAGEKNIETERRRANREAARNRAATLRQDAEAAKAERDETIAECVREIARLQARIDEVKADCERMVELSIKQADELDAKLAASEPLPDAVDTTALAAKLGEARASNKKLEDWERQRGLRAQHQKKADEHSKEYDALTDRIAKHKAAREDAIRKSELPVAGLGFGEGFITLNGVRFKQVNTAAQRRTAFAISVAKRPKLPLCWIRDASLLDDETRRDCDELAKEFGCQVIYETVKPTVDNAILLEDGHLKGVEPPAEPESPPFELSAEPPTAKKKQPRRWQGPGAPTGESP